MSNSARKTRVRDPATTIQAVWRDVIKNPKGALIFARDAESPFIWWVLIRGVRNLDDITEDGVRGPENQFQYAEFLVKMQMDEVLPLGKPPKFWVQTPNCVYALNKRPCIAIGEYHSDDYLTGLGPAGFASEIANGINSFPELNGGKDLVYGAYTTDDMRKHSKESKEYNWKHNKNIMISMKTQYDKHLEKWLKVYPDDYKDPSLAGKYRNEEIRRNVSLSPNYIDSLKWDPEPR